MTRPTVADLLKALRDDTLALEAMALRGDSVIGQIAAVRSRVEDLTEAVQEDAVEDWITRTPLDLRVRRADDVPVQRFDLNGRSCAEVRQMPPISGTWANGTRVLPRKARTS